MCEHIAVTIHTDKNLRIFIQISWTFCDYNYHSNFLSRPKTFFLQIKVIIFPEKHHTFKFLTYYLYVNYIPSEYDGAKIMSPGNTRTKFHIIKSCWKFQNPSTIFISISRKQLTQLNFCVLFLKSTMTFIYKGISLSLTCIDFAIVALILIDDKK